MKKLGPRACVMCGPTIQGCHVCSATLGHRHLIVVDRHGEQVGSVAACDAHSPPSGVLVDGPALLPSPVRSGIGSDLHKRTRDRAYRLATSIVRERHYDEFADLYAQVLAGEVEGRDAA